MDNKENHYWDLLPRYNKTRTLPPVQTEADDEVSAPKNQDVGLKFAFFRAIAELTSSKNDKEKEERLNLLNKLRTAEEAEYTQIDDDDAVTITEQPKECENVGNDVIMIENTDELTDVQRKVYNIIIGAFKAKKISDSSIYCILQNIPYVDIVDNIIVIYTKQMNIFEKVEVPCVNIATALRDGFKNDDLKIQFIPCKVKTIADYFIGANYNMKI